MTQCDSSFLTSSSVTMDGFFQPVPPRSGGMALWINLPMTPSSATSTRMRRVACWNAPPPHQSELSKKHTPALACRSLDILPVATAVELPLVPQTIKYPRTLPRFPRA